MANFEYLITRPGILKLVTIVFGIISFILISFSYSESPYTDFYSNMSDHGEAKNLPGTELELYEYFATGLFLGLSIAYLIVYAFVYELCESKLNRLVDTGFHLSAALFLFAGGSVALYSAVEIQDYGCAMYSQLFPNGEQSSGIIGILSPDTTKCHHFKEKIVGSIFTLLNAALYGITAVTVFITKDL